MYFCNTTRRAFLSKTPLLSLLFASLSCKSISISSKKNNIKKILTNVRYPWLLILNTSTAQEYKHTEDHWIYEHLSNFEKTLNLYNFSLPKKVLIRLHATRQSFSFATGQSQQWLTAYATWDIIDMLEPHLWRHNDAQSLQQKLFHELFHIAMFQSFSTEQQATAAQLPFWFKEGAASIFASQHNKRVSFECIKEYTLDSKALKEQHFLRYGLAHHFCLLLQQKYGKQIYSKILGDIKVKHLYAQQPRKLENIQKNTFDAAFRAHFKMQQNALWQKLKKT